MSSWAEDFADQLASWIATQLSINASAVYRGREPQAQPVKDLEVWVRYDATTPFARGLGAQGATHAFEVHVRMDALREGNRTGASQLDTVKEHLETLRRGLHGRLPWGLTPASLIDIAAEELDVDDDPSQQRTLDGMLMVRAREAD